MTNSLFPMRIIRVKGITRVCRLTRKRSINGRSAEKGIMIRSTCVAVVAVLLACVIAIEAQAPSLAPAPVPRITVTNLGTVDGTLTLGFAINEAGHIVGGSAGGKAFYWSHQTGFITISDGAFARDINNRNQAIGSYQIADGTTHGFLWDLRTEGIQDLGEFIPLAMNDRGDVAGALYVDGFAQPFVYIDGSLQELSLEEIGGAIAGVALDINNRGVVVGTFQTSETSRAFTWNKNTGFAVLEPPQPFKVSTGEAINDAGRVFGVVAASGDFLEEPIFGTFWNVDGSIDSVAPTPSRDMVASGALNSRSWTIRSGTKLWIDQYGPIDLPGLEGDRYAGANGLNNGGVIVGSLPDPSGAWNLAVWTVDVSSVR